MRTRSTLTESAPTATRGKPFLLVLGPDVFTTYELPEKGSIVVGRRVSADLWIDDPLLSSDHVRISVDGGYSVEDLGSTNGTFLRGERLAASRPAPLPIGEAITVGSCLLVVQTGRSASRHRRSVSYGFLRMRLDEELARARHESSRRFSMARIQLPSQPPIRDVQAAASEVLRAYDTFCAYAPDDYMVLYAQTEPDEARRLTAELCASLEARGATPRSALARYPEDGRTPEELEARCLRLLRPSLGSSAEGEDFVAESPLMQSLFRFAERAARSQISVLVTGETGAGKDVVARFVHARSPRSRAPFQAINCAALPEQLLEAQLFGYERGAFTGAARAQKGLIEAADGGTIFLDEIAEVPLTLQAKLLRLLDNSEIQVLGATRPQKVDVRFVAATNVDLVEAVATKRFRADLLHRLKGLELKVPPLRERREDILPLAQRMLLRYAQVERLEQPPTLSAAVVIQLTEYPWPGNVRELANVIHRAVVLSDGKTITEDELVLDDAPVVDEGDEPSEPESPNGASLAESVERKPSHRVSNPSKRRVSEVLDECGGNQSRAAQVLGIPRKRLRDLIDYYELPRPRGR